MLTNVLVACTLAGALASEEAAARAALQVLRDYAAWYDSIAQAAIPFSEGETPPCKTTWEAFIAARASYGCSDSDSFSCDSVSGDATKTAACCRWDDSQQVNSHFLTSHKDADDQCSNHYKSLNADATDQDAWCCKICTTPESDLYPFTCTHAGLVGVSVCAAGDTPLSPLRTGYDCSTSPQHATNGKYETEACDGGSCTTTEHTVPGCTQVDADFEAGRAGSAVWADVLKTEESPLNDYAKMRQAAAFVERAVLAGGNFSFTQDTTCAVFLEPTVGEGSSFSTYDDSCGAYNPADGCDYSVDPATVVTTADMRIYKPTVMANAAASTFSLGDITVIGGSNAAKLYLYSIGQIKLQGLVNSGTVMAWSAPNVFIGDTVNSGDVVVDTATAVLINITNSGQVNATGGSYTMYDIQNEVGGSVVLANNGGTAATVTLKNVANGGSVLFYDGAGSSTITLAEITNTGSVTMSGGTATGTAITNAGTITIAAGNVNLEFTTNAGGSIVVAAGVTGTITLAAGGEGGATTFPASAAGLTVSGFADAPPASPSPAVPPPASPSPSPPTPPSVPPPLPPPPAPPPMTTIASTFTANGNEEDYDADKKGKIASVVADAAGVEAEDVAVDVVAGSVVITTTIMIPVTAAEATVATLTDGIFADAASLQTALKAANPADFAGLAVAEITVAPTVASPPPPPLSPPSPPSPVPSPLPVDEEGDTPCFGRSTTACRLIDPAASPAAAFAACFEAAGRAVAERVPMTDLVAGDLVLSGEQEVSRVVVNQHVANTAHASAMLRVDFGAGSIDLTPDHVIRADGKFVPARAVAAGSMLGGHKVERVSRGRAGVVNPVTVAGTVLAAGKEGAPVVASTYPEWIAEYMLSSSCPLPFSLGNLLSFLFPAKAQAFYDGLVEPLFPAGGESYRSYLELVPPALSPLAVVGADLAVSSAFALFALGPVALAASAVAIAAAAGRK